MEGVLNDEETVYGEIGIGSLAYGKGTCGFRGLIILASRLWGTAFEICFSFHICFWGSERVAKGER